MDDLTSSAVNPAGELRRMLRLTPGSPFVLAVMAYLLLALILLPTYMNFQFKDELNYVAAAERYARGDFANAPNSYWGPLTSWLIAVGLALGASSLAAGRTVMIVLGVATLWSVDRLAKTMAFPDGLRRLYLLTAVPYVTYFALPAVNADLPLTALLAFYFAVIFDRRYPDRRYAGALCGALGAFAYFAKSFALIFFLVHFAACTAVHWIANSETDARRKLLRHFLSGILVFAALAAIWMGALYQKYGEVTIGHSGLYNFQISTSGSNGIPTENAGFIKPPQSTTVSIWEDPAFLYQHSQARECCLRPRTPFAFGPAIKHQLMRFDENLGRTLTVFLAWSPLALGVGFTALAYCFTPFWPTSRRKVNSPPQQDWRASITRYTAEFGDALLNKQRLIVVLMLITIVVFAMPYTLIYSHERYLWPLLVVLMGLGFYLLQIFSSTYAIEPKTRAWLFGLFAASFLLYPIYRLSTGTEARETMSSIARQIESETYLSGTRIASGNDYGASMIMAYHLHAKYYGMAAPRMSDERILEDLRDQDIEYYFVWNIPVVERPGMSLLKVLKSDFRTVAIYKVDPQGRRNPARR